jgi:hypothetical protein
MLLIYIPKLNVNARQEMHAQKAVIGTANLNRNDIYYMKKLVCSRWGLNPGPLVRLVSCVATVPHVEYSRVATGT